MPRGNQERWLEVEPGVEHLLNHVIVHYVGSNDQSLLPGADPRTGPRWSRDAHPAALERVLMVRSGSARLDMGRSSVQLREGEIGVVASGVPMRGHVDRNSDFACTTTYFNVWLYGDIPLFRVLPCPPVFTGPAAEALRGSLEAIEADRESEDPIGKFSVHAQLMLLLCRIYRAPAAETRGEMDANHSSGHTHPVVLHRAIAGMVHAARNGVSLSVAEMAQRFNRDRASFTRLFTTHVGVAPAHFFERIRMDVARERLRQHQLSVAEVAASVGYRDPYHFSRAFRRVTGETATDWRNREAGMD